MSYRSGNHALDQVIGNFEDRIRQLELKRHQVIPPIPPAAGCGSGLVCSSMIGEVGGWRGTELAFLPPVPWWDHDSLVGYPMPNINGNGVRTVDWDAIPWLNQHDCWLAVQYTLTSDGPVTYIDALVSNIDTKFHVKMAGLSAAHQCGLASLVAGREFDFPMAFTASGSTVIIDVGSIATSWVAYVAPHEQVTIDVDCVVTHSTTLCDGIIPNLTLTWHATPVEPPANLTLIPNCVGENSGPGDIMAQGVPLTCGDPCSCCSGVGATPPPGVG